MSTQLQSYLNAAGKNPESFGVVLQRYQPQVQNEQEAFPHFLKRNQLSENFIQNLAAAFENLENFCASDYRSVSIPAVLTYLKNTHEHYQCYYLSKIDRSIENLYSIHPEAEELLDLLKLFFTDYQKDINAHIAEEEEELFPYIEKMLALPAKEFLRISAGSSFSIAAFKKQHNDENEDALLQVIQLIHQRFPSAGFSPVNILLMQIRQFEKDLRIHSRIEEEVLLPKAEQLEKLISKQKRSLNSKQL